MNHNVVLNSSYGGNYHRYGKYFAVFSTLLLMLGLFQWVYPSEVTHAAPTPPAATTSFYVSTLSASTHYNFGCEQGHRSTNPGPANGVVLLSFGKPLYRNNTYGTLLYNGLFASTTQIGDAVKQFAAGFWACTPFNGPRLRIGIGTTNLDNSGVNFYNHGRAWALMVNDVGAYVRNQPGWSAQLSITGANDIEVDWSTPVRARDWINGYDSANNHIYYDFGDAAGCYPYNPSGQPDMCNNNWRREDVWYKAYGAGPAWPIPEIYFTINNLNPRIAGQWQKISLYGYINHGFRVIFAGTMTQYDACGGNGTPRTDSSCYNNGDPNTGVFTNSPGQGWSQLWDKLNGDTRTAQGLGWATDISWRLR